MTSPIDLRLGRYQEALVDVAAVDAIVTDPPYGLATHDACAVAVVGSEATADGANRRPIEYSSWGGADVAEFVDSWAPRCRGWFVALTSHDLVPEYRAAFDRHDRYTFAPLPFVAPGSRVRLAGDGPSSWTCWIVVSRPRSYNRWGTLPGAYVLPAGHSERYVVTGGKPTWLMRHLVRDYSRAGELVCDPCAGGATTLIAAAMEGRRAIGAEMDRATFAKAQRRIAAGYTPDLFAARSSSTAEVAG